MKKTVALLAAMAAIGLTASTQEANAVVYCKYIGYPTGCVARPGVHLVARPAGVGTVGVGGPAGVGGGGGAGVNRAGVRR